MAEDTAAEIERLKDQLTPLRRSLARIPHEKAKEKKELQKRIDAAQSKLNALHIQSVEANIRTEIDRLRGSCVERTDFVSRFSSWCEICAISAGRVLSLATNAKEPESLKVDDPMKVIALAFSAAKFNSLGLILNGVKIAMKAQEVLAATSASTPSAPPVVNIAADMQKMFVEMALEKDDYYDRFIEEMIPKISTMDDVDSIKDICSKYDKKLPKPDTIEKAILKAAIESADDSFLPDDILIQRLGDAGYLRVHIRVWGQAAQIKAQTTRMYIDDIGSDLTFAVMKVWSGKSIFDLPIAIGGQIELDVRSAFNRIYGGYLFARSSRKPGDRNVKLVPNGPGMDDFTLGLARDELFALKVDQLQNE